MGSSTVSYYNQSAGERAMLQAAYKARADAATQRIADARTQLAAKIIMAAVDKIVAEIIRPGPLPEERECYDMAGELRALVPELEQLAKRIIDVNEGVE